MDEARHNRQILLAAGVLGANSLITQMTLWREFLRVFTGNELVLGVVLGNWLLLTGVGAALDRHWPVKNPRLPLVLGGLAAVSVLPIGLLIGGHLAQDRWLLPGEAVGFLGTLGISFAVLLPLCLLGGWLLALTGSLAQSRNGQAGLRQVYIADGLGSVLGGLFFGLAGWRWFNHFQILWGVAVMGLTATAWLAWLARERGLFLSLALLDAIMLLLAMTVDLDLLFLRRQHPGQEIVYRGNSPYGRWVVTQAAGETQFFENDWPDQSMRDLAHVEGMVHYALAQRPDAARVLLVSGGLSGTLRELRHYPAVEVVYVELDPVLLDLGRRFRPEALAGPRLRVVNTDGRRFIQQTPERFDVVIVDVPEPQTAQLNRFFTLEFFREIKRVLNPGGVVEISLGHYANYIGPEHARLLACLHATLRAVFDEILALPAESVFFLASDRPLTPDLASHLEKAQVRTRMVNRSFLAAALTRDRLDDLARAFTAVSHLNEDFHPVLYLHHQKFWLSQFQTHTGWWLMALSGLTLIGFWRASIPSLAVFAAGFAASSLEVVLLLGFQVLCGSLYSQLSILVTLFMGGLAFGAWQVGRWKRVYPGALGRTAAAIAGLSLLIPWGIITLARWRVALPSETLPTAIGAFTIMLAILVGRQFPLAAGSDAQSSRTRVARIYWADFLGASAGAFLVSAWLLPTLGITGVAWIVAGLNGVVGILAYVRRE